MATFRTVKQDGDFVLVHKGFIYDDNLSARAKGVLLYLLSRPNDWQIYTSEVQKHMKDGVKSVNSAVNELINVGYIKRTLKRSDKGTFKGYEYLVYETPTEMPLTENGQTENGLTENGQTENRQGHTTNNNRTNNDLTNNNNTNNDKTTTSGNPTYTPYKEIIDYLNKKTGKRFSHKSKANQKLIQARFNEDNSKEDFFKVIDNMAAQWKGHHKMDEYLRPKTLFSGNFDNYLNQQVNNKESDDNPYANLF